MFAKLVLKHLSVKPLCISQLYNKLTGIETIFVNFVITTSQNSEVSCKVAVAFCSQLQKKGAQCSGGRPDFVTDVD